MSDNVSDLRVIYPCRRKTKDGRWVNIGMTCVHSNGISSWMIHPKTGWAVQVFIPMDEENALYLLNEPEAA